MLKYTGTFIEKKIVDQYDILIINNIIISPTYSKKILRKMDLPLYNLLLHNQYLITNYGKYIFKLHLVCFPQYFYVA